MPPSRELTPNQGDQIGRIFAYWTIVYFGQLLKMTEVSLFLGLLLNSGKRHVALILTKMGLAALWAIFSQTHLVTLHPM
jgi:hypothetical protein